MNFFESINLSTSDWIVVIITSIISLLIGLFVANPYFRFYFEKFVRKILGKKLISIKLSGFEHRLDDETRFLVHCIDIKNTMWFTSNIQNIYFLSRGSLCFNYDAHAYKPLIYFRSRSPGIEEDFNIDELINYYNNKIIPHYPGDLNSSINLLKGYSLRIIVLCESISKDDITLEIETNHQKILGRLYASVSNPMPIVSPNDSWTTSIISETFGVIDILDFTIPKDLPDIEPLGDSLVVRKMPTRRACLLDIGYMGSTWPLRFIINNYDIQIKKGRGRLSKKVILNKTEDTNKKKDNISRRFIGKISAYKFRKNLGIKIQ